MARRKNTSTEIKAAASGTPASQPEMFDTPSASAIGPAEAAAATDAAAIEESAAIEEPAAIGTPAADVSAEAPMMDAAAETAEEPQAPRESQTPLPEIRLASTDAPRIEIPADAVKAAAEPPKAEGSERPIFPIAREADASRWRRNRSALLAASVAFAAVLGGAIGAAATMSLSQPAPPVTTAADETQALHQTVTKLSRELHALKSGFDSTGRTTASQFNRIAERLDRAEKAQAEPAAKLARIAETLDRIERRPATAVAAAAPHAVAPARAADVTGSIPTADRSPARPAVVEGWRLRDFYAGRAILENRSSRTLYDIGPGSVLPGLGKIEQIKRNQNQVTVVTPKGIITAELAPPPRRSPYYGPYR